MDILNTTNFNSLSQQQLVEMIRVLQAEVKNLRFNKSYDAEARNNHIITLEQKIQTLTHDNLQLKKNFQAATQIMFKPLTWKERIMGKLFISDKI